MTAKRLTSVSETAMARFSGNGHEGFLDPWDFGPEIVSGGKIQRSMPSCTMCNIF